MQREEAFMARVEVNTQATAFTLPDFTGKPVALSDFNGRQHVLLVFNRGFV